jgi:beta-N-acetylhexosaminidase
MFCAECGKPVVDSADHRACVGGQRHEPASRPSRSSVSLVVPTVLGLVCAFVFLVSSGVATAAASTLYQQNSSMLIYSGTWTASSSTPASGGSFRYANTSGSSMTAYFNGTSLAWIAKKSNVYGKARVTLDDEAPVLVDLYSASTMWKQTVWSTGTLTSGYHRVKIEWTGQKRTASRGTNINVDALEIDGAPTSAPTRYQQTDTRLSFTGKWTTSSTTSASGGTFGLANSTRSSVTVKFTGVCLVWIAKKSPAYGKASVSVDGGPAVTVNLYNSTTVWRQQVWRTKWLTSGTHSVTISWTGTKSAAATATNINVDSFDILGKPLPALPPLDMLSAEQLAGQRVIYGYLGLTPPSSLLTLISAGKAAGVIFFGGNISSVSQIASVCAKLQAANAKSTNPIRAPLLLMTDQEGGKVHRVPGEPVLSEKEIGASADPAAAAAKAGSGAGKTLKAAGMNVNLAPVLDVYLEAGNFIDHSWRSYSADPAVVSECGATFVTAQQGVGPAATVKHFPGLGAATTSENTDGAPVTLDVPLDSLRSVDESPYAAAIAAKVRLVMLSWAVYPALDPGVPAGLSSAIVQGELRERLGFGGVTITDALGAGALQSYGTLDKRAVLAAGAGMDLMLCSGRSVTQGQTALSGLGSAYASGKLGKSGFQSAVQRIVDLRSSLGSGA